MTHPPYLRMIPRNQCSSIHWCLARRCEHAWQLANVLLNMCRVLDVRHAVVGVSMSQELPRALIASLLNLRLVADHGVNRFGHWAPGAGPQHPWEWEWAGQQDISLVNQGAEVPPEARWRQAARFTKENVLMISPVPTPPVLLRLNA